MGAIVVFFLVAVLQLFVVFFFVCFWLFKDLAHDSFPCTPGRTCQSLSLAGLGRFEVSKLKRDYAPSPQLCNDPSQARFRSQHPSEDHPLDLIGPFNDLKDF